jgi:hypothetical protein
MLALSNIAHIPIAQESDLISLRTQPVSAKDDYKPGVGNGRIYYLLTNFTSPNLRLFLWL